MFLNFFLYTIVTVMIFLWFMSSPLEYSRKGGPFINNLLFVDEKYSYPTDFKCKIRPRSKTFKNLILQEFLEIHPNIL